MGTNQIQQPHHNAPWTIRRQLYVLILTVALPFIGLLAYSLYNDISEEYEKANQTVLGFAQLTERNISKFFVDSESILERIAAQPSIRSMAAPKCTPALRNFRNSLPTQFANIAAVDRSGQIVCSALAPPNGKLPSAAGLRWFETVMKTENFVVGEVQVGRISKTLISVLAFPIKNDEGTLLGALALAVDLLGFQSVISDVLLPPGSTITILDHSDKVVARSLEPEAWVGKKVSAKLMLGEDRQAPSGYFRAPGLDEVDRIWGYVKVPKAEWFVYVGLPVKSAFAGVYRSAYQQLTIALVILVLIAAFAYLLSRKIADPIDELAASARAAAEGRWDVHAPAQGAAEVVAAAAQFNAMLQARGEAEKQLKESEGLKTAILDAALDCIITIDHEGRIFEFNPAAEATFGYRREDVVGKVMADLLVPPALREKHRQGLARFVATGDSKILGKRLEMTAKRADGSEFPIELSITRLNHTEPPLFTGYIHDITNRRQNEQRIRRNLERMRALHEVEWMMASTLELRHLLTIVLDKIDAVLGYAAVTLRLVDPETGEMERIACRRIDERDWQARVSKAGLSLGNQALVQRQPVIALNAQTDPRTGDREFLRKYGFITYIGVPLIAKEKTLGVLSFYTKEEREVSEEELDFLEALAGQMALAIYNAQLYEALRKREAELEAANKVKDEFLGMMSHELRTPLNVILGYTGLLEDHRFGPLLETQMTTLHKIKRQSSELLRMVNDILDVTQIEAKKATVHAEAIKVGDLFAELKALYDSPLAKNLNFVWDLCPDPPAIVTDGKKLRHILQNLINNAIKFTERGAITVACERHSESNAVTLKVSDTGVGISKSSLPAIFDMFHQAGGSESKLYGGVGLGLYIVKKFTEALGGTVEVESEVGKGSTFTVTLPREIKN